MHDEFIFCFGFSLILGRGRMDGLSKLGVRFHIQGSSLRLERSYNMWVVQKQCPILTEISVFA